MQAGATLLIEDCSENLPNFPHFKKLISRLPKNVKNNNEKKIELGQSNLFIDFCLLDDMRCAELIITAFLS